MTIYGPQSPSGPSGRLDAAHHMPDAYAGDFLSDPALGYIRGKEVGLVLACFRKSASSVREITSSYS
jgi:hypothetical protein